MPPLGVPAEIEVYEMYAAGLLDIGTNSHIVVVSWLHLADRNVLQLDGVGPDNLPLQKGVFAVRSPSRPNPLAISTSKLVGVQGNRLFLDRLDMIDGTQVVDIKGYTRGGDCIFSARTFWDQVPPSQLKPGRAFEMILSQAENFHGKRCTGIVAGAKLVAHVSEHWDVPTRDEELVFAPSLNARDSGCLIDAIMGSTGAILGNGRLAIDSDGSVRAYWRGKSLSYSPRWKARISPDEAIGLGVNEMFEIAEKSGVPDVVRQQGVCKD
jgi:tRNA-Thr(GGU) m(6)t(6)A37 methyltransferase TsaA